MGTSAFDLDAAWHGTPKPSPASPPPPSPSQGFNLDDAWNQGPGVLSQYASTLGRTLGHAIMHPIDTAESMAKGLVTAPLSSLNTAMAPGSESDVARLNDLGRTGKGGPVGVLPYRSADIVTPAQRAAAVAQAVTTTALPGASGAIEGALTSRGTGSLLAKLLATSATSAPVGAAYDPQHPLVGALTAATLAPIIHAAGGASSAIATGAPKLIRSATGLGTETEAYSRLADIMRQSGQTPQQIGEVASAQKAAGSPIMLADALGTPGEPLVRWVMNQPAQGAADLRAALTDRHEGQYDRILTGAKDAVGQDPANNPQTIDALIAQQRQHAGPAYSAAYAEGPVATPTLSLAQNDPDFAKAIQKGYALKAKVELMNPSPPQVPAPGSAPMTDQEALYSKLLTQTGGNTAAATAAMKELGMKAPAPQAGSAPAGAVPIDVLDYAKRYLDNGIRRGFDASSTFDHTTATFTNRLLSKVLDEVDAQRPKFAAARALYHSDEKMFDAHDLGQQALTMPPDELAAGVQKLSPAQQDVFRASAMSAFKQKAANVADRNDLSKQFLANPAMRERFQTITPNADAFGVISDLADREGRMAKTYTAGTGNSTTAAQLQMNASMNGGITPADIAVAPFSPRRAVRRMVGKFGQSLQDQSNVKLADQLGPMLQAAPDSPELTSILARLMEPPSALRQGVSNLPVRKAVLQAALLQGPPPPR